MTEQLGHYAHMETTISFDLKLLTATPMGILIVYRDRLWEFRVLSNGSI